MSALERWRAEQHEELITADEVKAWDWLEQLRPDDVLADLTTRMSPSEIALLIQATRSAAA